MTQLSVVLSAFIAFFITSSAVALDCAHPRTSAEVAACIESELRDSDGKIDPAYGALGAKLDQQGRIKLRDEQRAWLKTRNQTCGIDSGQGDREAWLRGILKDHAKASCVARMTRARIEQLARYPVPGAPAVAQSAPPTSKPAGTAAPMPQTAATPTPALKPDLKETRAQAAEIQKAAAKQDIKPTPAPSHTAAYNSPPRQQAYRDAEAAFAEYSLPFALVIAGALVATARYGVWGIAGSLVVLGALAFLVHFNDPPSLAYFGVFLAMNAVYLGAMLWVMRRLLFPLSTRRLVRRLPLVVLISYVLTVACHMLRTTVAEGREYFDLIVISSAVYAVLHLIIGYAVVLPLYWRFGRSKEPASEPQEAVAEARDAPAGEPATNHASVRSAPAAASRQPATPAPSRPNYVEANYGVPHTDFERTEDGFTVTFNKTGEALFKLGAAASGGGGVLILLLLSVVLIVWHLIAALSSTRIVVDREWITIDGRRMRRQDFGTFHVHHSITVGNKQGSVLGYRYGSQNFSFGGVWEDDHATDVASALNRVLRTAPSAADDYRVSAEALRSARPTDF